MTESDPEHLSLTCGNIILSTEAFILVTLRVLVMKVAWLPGGEQQKAGMSH